MPKGTGYKGQAKTGFLKESTSNPVSRTGRDDGTTGGQKKVGHLPGSGGGGISRPSGKDPVGPNQGSTGMTTDTGGGRRKGQGEENPARTDEINEI